MRTGNKCQKGFAVLFAVLAASMVLFVGLSIFRFTLRELVLTSQIRDSQVAFSSADSAIECALFWDKKHPGREGSMFGYTTTQGITGALLTTGKKVDDDNMNTDPITPTSDAFVLVFVQNRISAKGAATPTLSGNGVVWEEVTSFLYYNLVWGSARLTLFRAVSSPSAGPVTIDFGSQTQDAVDWIISEYGNVDANNPIV